MGWNAIDNTSDWLANKLCPSDNHRECYQQNRCKRTMDPEHRIVDDDFLTLEVVLQA